MRSAISCYDSVGCVLVNLYGAHHALEEFRSWYDEWAGG